MFESAEAFSVLLGPIGGALIYSYFGLPGVILVDLITCIFGIVTISFFKSEKNENSNILNFNNVYSDLKEAYVWLKNQKGLLTLVSILSISNFLWGFTTVLLPPMVLTFSDARALGIIESTIGLAFLIGSIISLRYSEALQGNLRLAIQCGLLGGVSLIFGSL